MNNIGEGCFAYCEKLKTVKLGNGLKSIPPLAFNCCTNLKSVTGGVNIQKIEASAFYSCENLSKMEFGEKLEIIDDHAFCYCTMLKKVTLPESLAYINEDAFTYSGLTEAEIPGSVKSIGIEAFKECPNLTRLVFNEGTEYIGTEAFYQCDKLDTVSFNSSINYIGFNAFEDTPWLDKASGIKRSPTEIINDTQYVLINGNLIYIDSYERKQRNDGKWYHDTLRVLEVPEGTRIISCDLKIEPDTEEVIIPEGVQSINSIRCGSRDCEINLPSTLSEIPHGFGYSGFTSLTLPKGITKLCNSMFLDCEYLEELIIEGEITEIGARCFKDCKLTAFEIPDTVENIAISAFSGSNIKTITLPDDVIIKGAICNPEDEMIIYVKKGSIADNVLTKEFKTNSDKIKWKLKYK